MVQKNFQHVSNWVFDLDDTLYPPEMGLFDQIEDRMIDCIMKRLKLSRPEANLLRRQYWQRYGTTLAGLMHEHRLDPKEYLAAVHDVDFSPLRPDPELARAISNLPGRRIIFTNADRTYAAEVLKRRGLEGLFHAVYGVEEANYHPKPNRIAFDTIFGLEGLEPNQAAMFEDCSRNLVVPHTLGMQTVLVSSQPIEAPHIRYRTDDLAAFLDRIVTA